MDSSEAVCPRLNLRFRLRFKPIRKWGLVHSSTSVSSKCLRRLFLPTKEGALRASNKFVHMFGYAPEAERTRATVRTTCGLLSFRIQKPQILLSEQYYG